MQWPSTVDAFPSTKLGRELFDAVKLWVIRKQDQLICDKLDALKGTITKGHGEELVYSHGMSQRVGTI